MAKAKVWSGKKNQYFNWQKYLGYNNNTKLADIADWATLIEGSKYDKKYGTLIKLIKTKTGEVMYVPISKFKRADLMNIVKTYNAEFDADKKIPTNTSREELINVVEEMSGEFREKVRYTEKAYNRFLEEMEGVEGFNPKVKSFADLSESEKVVSAALFKKAIDWGLLAENSTYSSDEVIKEVWKITLGLDEKAQYMKEYKTNIGSALGVFEQWAVNKGEVFSDLSLSAYEPDDDFGFEDETDDIKKLLHKSNKPSYTIEDMDF